MNATDFVNMYIETLAERNVDVSYNFSMTTYENLLLLCNQGLFSNIQFECLFSHAALHIVARFFHKFSLPTFDASAIFNLILKNSNYAPFACKHGYHFCNTSLPMNSKTLQRMFEKGFKTKNVCKIQGESIFVRRLQSIYNVNSDQNAAIFLNLLFMQESNHSNAIRKKIENMYGDTTAMFLCVQKWIFRQRVCSFLKSIEKLAVLSLFECSHSTQLVAKHLCA